MEQAGNPFDEQHELRDLAGRTIQEAIEYRRTLDKCNMAAEFRAQAREAEMFDEQLGALPTIDLEAGIALFTAMATDSADQLRDSAACYADLLFAADKVAGTRIYCTLFYDPRPSVAEGAFENLIWAVEAGRILPEDAAPLADVYHTANARLHRKWEHPDY